MESLSPAHLNGGESIYEICGQRHKGNDMIIVVKTRVRYAKNVTINDQTKHARVCVCVYLGSAGISEASNRLENGNDDNHRARDIRLRYARPCHWTGHNVAIVLYQGMLSTSTGPLSLALLRYNRQ